jgi:glucose/arabinose dehydrogenase
VELGQGGLMEVTVHPNYRENGWIYLALSDPAKNGRGAMTKIVRGKLRVEGSKTQWTSQETIFEAAQEFYNGAGIHFGSRIVFDGKGHVFFVVGERGGNMLAQELGNPFGKIYRLNDDGSQPADNPFVGKGSAKHVGAIWSLGHRNPQGLAMDLKGNLWDTEHGPRGGDEVNRIQKGANYGWPVIALSINYNDAPFKTPWPKAGQNLTVPVARWLPSTGACGLDVAKGAAFPKWNGDLLAGGLVGQNLDRIRVSGDKLIEREELLHGMGRIRDVSVAADGKVYIALNEPDKIIRLVPSG